MGSLRTETVPTLTDADDYVTVELADGSKVEVYGDGLVYFFVSDDKSAPTRRINLYANDNEDVEF